MATLHFVALCFVLLAGATNAWGSIRLPEGAEIGDSCTETIRTPSRCGEAILLGSTETPLNASNGVEGPNVCRVTRMYMQATCSYTYQQFCRRRRCSIYCSPDGGCNNNTMVNFTRTSVQCCDGFAQGEPMEPEAGAAGQSLSRYFRKYFGRSSLRRDGCPVALRDTVFDCLEELDVSDFLSEVVQVPEVEDRLRSTDNNPTTVFAISDEAFRNLNDIARGFLFSDIARELTISAHIGEGQFVEKKLYRGRLINTLASNVSLHIGRTGNRTVEEFFANGVRISRTNACQARNGVVHIVDNVLPFSSATINDILTAQSSRFSTFQNLTEKAGIATQLDATRKSRTVFAPTNEAFDDFEGLAECLCREENARHLSRFVLIHISSPAEYTSTLSQRTYVPTFTYWYLRVNSSSEGITITNNEIPLLDADIPASNGVIHAIPEVILPFNEERLEEICPGITATMEPSTQPPIIIEPEATADPDGIPPGGVVVPPENVGR